MKTIRRVSVIALLLFLTSCLSWFLENPTFSLKEIEVKRFSLQDIDFLLGIEVQNPNSFDLKLRALEYTIYLRDQEAGKGRLEQEINVVKSASTLVPVPLRANLRNLGDPLALILAGKDLNYRIEGVAIIKARMGSTTIPFSKSGEINLKK